MNAGTAFVQFRGGRRFQGRVYQRKDNPMRKFFVEFLQREDGPTAVEYAVMLALIIVVCITAIGVLGNNASNKFNAVAGSIGS